MKLARDIIVQLGGEAIVLRPSLKLAFDVFRQHDLPALVQGITEGSLTLAAELIAPHSTFLRLEWAIIDAGGPDTVTPELLEYVLALAGIDPDAEGEPAKSKVARKTDAVNPEEQLIGLYRIGTGWLGWTPQATLHSSPAEIIEAHKGRLGMLQALFGGGGKPKATDGMDVADKVRFAFAELGATRVEG